jgi:hypothetical protein
MESVFTLPYSELKTVEILQQKLPKKEFSILLPISRQQKGFDCVVYGLQSKTCKTFQIKGSRTYERTEYLKRSKKRQFRYTLWFSNYFADYKPGLADVWILFGTYSIFQSGKNRITSRSQLVEKPIVLALLDSEMQKLSGEVRITKKGKRDQHLYIVFDNEKEVWATQAFRSDKNFTEYLLEKRVDELRKILSQKHS